MTATAESELLDGIGQDFLCCTICLEQFKSPKILPCLCTFCEQCLVAQATKKGPLNCPKCRRQHQLPEEGVQALESNFFVINLNEKFQRQVALMCEGAEIKCEGCQEGKGTRRCIECTQYLYQDCANLHRQLSHRLIEITSTGQGTVTQADSQTALRAEQYCNVHTEKKREFYCEVCQMAVCSDCTTHWTPKHTCQNLKDAAHAYHKELTGLLHKLKLKRHETETNKNAAQQAHCDLQEQRRRVEREVKMKAEELIERIRKEETRLLGELNENYQTKLGKTESDVDDLNFKHNNIESVCCYLEALMHHGNDLQLLSAKGYTAVRTEELITMETKFNQPFGEAEFIPSDKFPEHEILGGVRYDKICVSKCTAEIIPKKLLKGDTANLLITTKDAMENKVTSGQVLVVLAKIRKPDASWEDVKATDNKDGTYSIPVCGQLHGKYQVDVTIDDQQLTGSPFSISVIRGLVKTISSNVNTDTQNRLNPYGVAMNKNGDIITGNRGINRCNLQVFTTEGQAKKCFKFAKFKKPFRPIDIAVSGDSTSYCLDDNNDQIVVSDEDGNVIRRLQKLMLKKPQGVAISPVSGHVYVTDCGLHCVKIYSKHGKSIKSFGSRGSGQGEFYGPCGIAIGNNGMVYVADHANCRIQVFRSDNKYLYSFDCKGGDGKLRFPSGICVENDRYVYVSCQFNSCILKFESGGKFVRRVDRNRDRLNYPSALALTNDVPCRVVVADTGNHCIKVFVQ